MDNISLEANKIDKHVCAFSKVPSLYRSLTITYSTVCLCMKFGHFKGLLEFSVSMRVPAIDL